MFYVAPNFPQFCKKFLFLESFVLVLYFIAKINNYPYADTLFKLISSVVFLAFAVVAFNKLIKRRRKVSDASLKLWKSGLAFAIVWAILILIDTFIDIQQNEYLLGVIFGFGFVGSIIIAMIQKIIPFLVWFHLTSCGNFDAPNINELLPQSRALLVAKLHIVSVTLLVGGYFYYPLINIAGIIIVLLFTILEINIIQAAYTYKRLCKNL
jgi:hypothetical protein